MTNASRHLQSQAKSLAILNFDLEPDTARARTLLEELTLSIATMDWLVRLSEAELDAVLAGQPTGPST
jgi:hypothetical protein